MSRSWLDVAGLDGAPEDLWEDGDRRFCKIWRESTDGRRHPYLAVLPATDPPTRGCLRRLEHEYELKDHFDAGWALRPLELVRGRGATALVLAYQDGQPLERMIARPIEVAAFLRIAIAMAAALVRLHARGLVHKDVKPANILVDPAGDRVWLMGFGVASRIPRERQSPDPPELIAGTLSHMAPEQTGRMNRAVDSRSDLYSLGVTLYQAVTGTLPFMATDPLEWVHCHVARSPVPPSTRVTDVPPQLSAIIMKLLAKTPEERYQTAVGVERDLRRCLADWDTRRAIEEFPLAEHDLPDRLLIPERLYGREDEIDALLAAFDTVIASAKPSLVLVSGHPGIGKSSVVNELHKVLVPPRGLFASGKFDQLRRDIPYATLAQAFQSLLRQLLGKPEAELRKWREELRQALAPNGALLFDLIPELEFVIGEQPAVPEAAPADAKIRFQTVLRQLIGVFARAEHPLAMFLDDLQWLDAATLELLENILVQPEAQHLLLVGAYRDNEVDAAHPLKRTLSVIRENGAVVPDIVLGPLDDDDLTQWFADALHCSPERTRPLAQLVHEKTAGNPFFANQFLQELVEDDLVTFETDAGGWHWDLAPIRSRGYTDNVVDLMVGKLSRLPLATQDALKDLACLGNRAETSTLAMVHEVSDEQLHSDLWEALRLELVVRSDDSYRFVHDRVQEAAYALIPEERRAPAHLRIGRLLIAKIPPDKREEVVFDIVSHYNRASSLLTSPDEREQLAALNLVAAGRAKASAAFASALSFVANGAALLTEESWQDRHALAFALQLTRAECEYLTHEFGPAEERLDGLSLRATTLVERAAVAALQTEIYWTLGQGDRAIGLGLDYLRHVGVDWSPHPSDEDARREYDRIRTQFGRRSIEDLIDQPLLTDAASLATLDILVKLAAPAFTSDSNLLTLVACCGASISMERGNCDASCAAYEWLAIAAGRFGDYDAAYRFGRLGYELTEQRGLRRFQARTYLIFGSMVIPWTKPIGTARDVLRRAFTAANEVGDMSVVASSGLHLNSNMLAAGDPLLDVEAEAERGLARAQQTRFGLMIDVTTVQLALIRTLRGQTWRFGHLDDDRCEERELEKRLPENPNLQFAECCYWIRKLQARALAGEWAAAIEAARQSQRLVRAVRSFPEEAEYHFFSALSHAACVDSASDDERPAHVETLAAHHRQLVTWAQRCPENFQSRTALVGAERARIEGRELDAEHLYEAAIKSARERAFVHDEALANERASGFYAARGLETISQAYLRNARYGYVRWGAGGKIRQLDSVHPHLRAGETSAARTGTIETPVEQLDLTTVIRVSQAVSAEMNLEKLLDTIMRTAIEVAGAERAVLLLSRGVEQRVAAEVTTTGNTVTVRLRDEPAAGSLLPETMVRYVLQTKESVILDDAATPNLFSTDPYIGLGRARSVLCVPLSNQAKLTGVLYLENDLAPRVFAPARIAVLKLLTSQAAISLENARLYRDLAERERESRLIAESIPGLVALLSPTGYVDMVNPPLLKYFGRTLEELRELGTIGSVHPEDLPHVVDVFTRSLASGTPYEIVQRLRRADGVYRWVQNSGFPFRETNGQIARWCVLLTDIDDRKRAEEALVRRERELRLLVDTIPALMWRGTPAGELEYLNQRAVEYLGHTAEGLSGGRWLELVHPDHRDTTVRRWLHSVTTGSSYDDVYKLRRADGQYRWVQSLGEPLHDAEGGIVDWYGSVNDIDDLKRTEEALRESELESRLIVDSIPGLVIVLTPTGELGGVNNRVIEFCGRPLEALRDWANNDTLHSEDRARVNEHFAALITSGLPSEWESRLRRFDGVYRWFQVRGLPLRDSNGSIVRWYVLLTDIEDRKHAETEIAALKDQLYKENLALRDEVDRTSMFEEIIGTSPALRPVLIRVAKVARTESTVLITGETGTGKELVARAIHRRSARASQAFVSVNCAAIPRELIASELFGHEKGAFTGATQRRLGRFELAHGGTIFLDEVGDLPMETQVMLLRVLQEREFERVGSSTSIRADVRIVTATNRDLQAAIHAGTFRSDLFYRLNVFPIAVPALRERTDDIPMLVEYFIDRYARKAGKTIRRVNKRTLDHLRSYPWPGNVRELQNVIERSVIVCDTDEFIVDESWLSARPTIEGSLVLSGTVAAHEKALIEEALRASGGRVYGPAGAAARLGVARSTLESKIRALKINKNRFRP